MTSRDAYKRTPLIASILFYNKNGYDDTLKYLLEIIRVPMPDFDEEETIMDLLSNINNKDKNEYDKLINIFDKERTKRDEE